MPINFVMAVTHGDWLDLLRRKPNLQEVNFRSHLDKAFKAQAPVELFPLELLSPRRFIVSRGIFMHANSLP